MITSPQLPPKSGYVEVEVDGVRKYKNAKTGILLEDEQPVPPLEEQLVSAYREGVASA